MALCTLAVAAATLLGTAGAGAPGAATRPATDAPPLALASQTPWVTPDAPWFNIAFAVGAAQAPASGLHVSLTFYSRLDDSSQLQQAIAGTPPTATLLRLGDVPVSAGGGGLTASTCVTVLPDAGATAPADGAGRLRGRQPHPDPRLHAAHRPLRRRLPGRGVAAAPGIERAAGALHDVPHLSGAERHRRRRQAARRGRPAGHGGRRDGDGGRPGGPPRRAHHPRGEPAGGEHPAAAARPRRAARPRPAGRARQTPRCSTSPTCRSTWPPSPRRGSPGRSAPRPAGVTTCCAPPASSPRAARGSTPRRPSRRATPATWPRACRWPGPPSWC